MSSTDIVRKPRQEAEIIFEYDDLNMPAMWAEHVEDCPECLLSGALLCSAWGERIMVAARALADGPRNYQPRHSQRMTVTARVA